MVSEVYPVPASDAGYAGRTLVSQAAFHGRRLWFAVWPPLTMLVLVAISWEIMARTLGNPLIPNLADIGGRFAGILLSGLAFEEMGNTLTRVLVGLSVAFPAAVIIGISSGRSEAVRRFFEPIILLGLTIPSIVWALLCVIWFGVSLTNPVVTVAMVAIPALSLNIQQGTSAIGSDLTDMVHVYKFSLWHRIIHLWIPAVAPYLLAGLRLGLSHAWKVVVLVEIFGMPNGMGYQISYEFGSHSVAGVLAWTLVFAITLSIIEYGILKNIEKFSTRWRTVSKI